MRTIIELRTDQVRALDARCATSGISRAEAIRRAVDSWLEGAGTGGSDDERLFREAFGMWADRDTDALEYTRRLRAEWDR
ncbi:MAG: ribbon-helix-helix protein, CopG family [Dehalococcoidia bacterium]